MKLSIIVPVYNAEKYLVPCLDSLVSQGLDDYEIILVNDGSKDGSGQIMEQYRQSYPELIRTCTVENGGQGRARNIGISMSGGEYVGFVDSDDYIEKHMYSELLKKAEEENADIVVCNFRRAYDDGSEEICISWNENEVLHSAGSCCDKIFKRELIGEVRFPEGVWYEDFCFSSKLLMRAKKVVNVDDAMYVYRCGQISTMNNQNSTKNLDMLSVMEDIRTFMVDNKLSKKGFEFLLINHVLLDTINRVSKHDTESREQVIESLRLYIKEHVPKLFSCESYKNESIKRRIIMALNYYGLYRLSKIILQAK